jgi:nucleoside-diphosphate-sugar epimerase
VGGAVAKRLADAGQEVTGLKRHPPTQADNIVYMAADITISAQLENLDTDFDTVFFILSPDGSSEHSYRAVYETGLDNLLNHFADAKQSPNWFFTSSTSVYSQTQGEWVNEESIAQPENRNSQLIRQAELKVMAANPNNIVVRFSGIYGEGREYLLRLAKQTPAIQKNPPYFTNRIHQHDCVEVLLFLWQQQLNGKMLEQCYLASDDEPVPTWDVMNWLTEQMNCSPPTIKINSTNEMNKRCDNRRLKALGYQFRYPNYQTGYLPLIVKI